MENATKYPEGCWLDGYLKGLVDSRSELRERIVACARIVELGADGIIESFLRIINDPADEQELGVELPELILKNEKKLDNWMEAVSREIMSLFPEDRELILGRMVADNVLDMIDSMPIQNHDGDVYFAEARAERYSGTYLFFKLEFDFFLVLSFMKSSDLL